MAFFGVLESRRRNFAASDPIMTTADLKGAYEAGYESCRDASPKRTEVFEEDRPLKNSFS